MSHFYVTVICKWLMSKIHFLIHIGMLKKRHVTEKASLIQSRFNIWYILYIGLYMIYIIYRKKYSGIFFGPVKCLKELIFTWWACFEDPILAHPIFSSKFMPTCPNSILVHISIVRISNFAPISIRSKNLDQNWKATPSRENELLRTLFWTKKYPWDLHESNGGVSIRNHWSIFTLLDFFMKVRFHKFINSS